MILSDKEILKEMEKGTIKIEPFHPHCMGTNSYDVHLGKTLATYVDGELDAKKHNKIEKFEIPPEGYLLQPDVFYLALLWSTRKLTHMYRSSKGSPAQGV